MWFPIFALVAVVCVSSSPISSHLDCICQQASGCEETVEPRLEEDSEANSAEAFQITLQYYEDCKKPGKHYGQSIEEAWKRCAGNTTCATQCIKEYTNVYRKRCHGMGECEIMTRLYAGGPNGCIGIRTDRYWQHVKKCLTKRKGFRSPNI